MNAKIGPTQRLAAYLARAADTALEPEIAVKAAICLLDAIGLAVAARDEPTAKAARALAGRPAEGGARLWADGTLATVGDAALANGIAAHAHFQDDTDHESWSHPGSLVPPAALALADANDLSLARTLRSVVAGYAAMQWLGRNEVVSRALIARGLRTSPTFGSIGAAASASVALGLDEARARSAVAIAAANTGGTLEPVRCGSDEWRIQNGRAAQGGIYAAFMAGQGVEGAPEALEGPKGFLASLAGLDTVPGEWSADPDPAIMSAIMAKPYATLGDNMPAAMAASLIAPTLASVGADAVTAIRVTLWRPYTQYPGTNFKGPFQRVVQTQASTAFAVSAMLLHGDITYDMGVTSRDDPTLNRLVGKTSILPHDGDALACDIEIELVDGRVLRASADDAPRTLLFQDEKRASEIFERRLSSAGRASGAGADIAARLLSAARGTEDLRTRALLDWIGGKEPRDA